MSLPTDRTSANSVAEHVADHNTLHTQHNTIEAGGVFVADGSQAMTGDLDAGGNDVTGVGAVGDTATTERVQFGSDDVVIYDGDNVKRIEVLNGSLLSFYDDNGKMRFVVSSGNINMFNPAESPVFQWDNASSVLSAYADLDMNGNSILDSPSVAPHISYLNERLPSETAHGDDEFFDTDPSGTTIAPTGTATWTVDTEMRQLSCVFHTVAANDAACYLLALTPNSAPVTVQIGYQLLGRWASSPKFGGIILTDGVTASDNAVAIWLAPGTDPAITMKSGTLTNLATAKGSSAAGPNPAGELHLRLIWSAANTFKTQFSPTGADGSWTDGGIGSQSVTLTPTYFGVWVCASGGTSPGTAVFDYFRVNESDLST